MIDKFISVGENIHCTRSVKSKGIRTVELPDGEGLKFKYKDEDCVLPVPSNWENISPVYKDGKIRHILLAIHQTLNGKTEELKKLGEKYLCWAAECQIASKATFLDVNVDDYTQDNNERMEVMKWLCTFLSDRYEIPLSIDTSNLDTLVSGLENCRKDTVPLVNSVSLEREEAVDIIVQFNAEAIVSAAGKNELPSTTEAKINNFEKIIGILDSKGIKRENMHLDPLVMPISVDSNNGKNLLESVTVAKEKFEGVNFNGGLSNVSFGMPKRNLLNLVFTYMFVQAGGNGGIVDPIHLSIDTLNNVDTESKSFKYAKAALDGTDMFCGEYIQAFRDGLL